MTSLKKKQLRQQLQKPLTKVCVKAARTQASTATNYDVGSTTWADLRQAPLLSAMEVTNLGHGPS
ncbi:hypothetical protein Hanom_Chr00s165753g01826861 [Helianthus anomalus]